MSSHTCAMHPLSLQYAFKHRILWVKIFQLRNFLIFYSKPQQYFYSEKVLLTCGGIQCGFAAVGAVTHRCVLNYCVCRSRLSCIASLKCYSG